MSNSVYHRYPPRPQRGANAASPAGSFSTNSLAAAAQSPSFGGKSFSAAGIAGSKPMTQPIRITEDAVESLVFLLAHSVEFQRSINTTFKAVDVKSDILGGITYPVCNNHNDSFIKAIPAAVSKIATLPYNLGSGDLAGALFLLRIKVIKQSTQYRLGFMATKVQNCIEEWEFIILKQQNDVMLRQRKSSSPPPSSSEHVSSSSGQDRLSSEDSSSAAYMGGPDAPSQIFPRSEGQNNSSSEREEREKLHFGNDIRQIRDVLTFISTKAFEAIDTYLAKDFLTAAELVYEISVEEKSAVS